VECEVELDFGTVASSLPWFQPLEITAYLGYRLPYTEQPYLLCPYIEIATIQVTALDILHLLPVPMHCEPFFPPPTTPVEGRPKTRSRTQLDFTIPDAGGPPGHGVIHNFLSTRRPTKPSISSNPPILSADVSFKLLLMASCNNVQTNNNQINRAAEQEHQLHLRYIQTLFHLDNSNEYKQRLQDKSLHLQLSSIPLTEAQTGSFSDINCPTRADLHALQVTLSVSPQLSLLPIPHFVRIAMLEQVLVHLYSRM
jgi:hypothetical protein